jgi:hypothetical protein
LKALDAFEEPLGIQLGNTRNCCCTRCRCLFTSSQDLERRLIIGCVLESLAGTDCLIPLNDLHHHIKNSGERVREIQFMFAYANVSIRQVLGENSGDLDQIIVDEISRVGALKPVAQDLGGR